MAHPVIVHIAGREAMAEWARDIPPFAEALAARFWPGPLTLVLKRAEGVDTYDHDVSYTPFKLS